MLPRKSKAACPALILPLKMLVSVNGDMLCYDQQSIVAFSLAQVEAKPGFVLARAPDGSCAETGEQAVDLIFAYWEDFWKRASDNQPGLDDRVASLLSSYPCQEASLWEFPIPEFNSVLLRVLARVPLGPMGGLVMS